MAVSKSHPDKRWLGIKWKQCDASGFWVFLLLSFWSVYPSIHTTIPKPVKRLNLSILSWLFSWHLPSRKCSLVSTIEFFWNGNLSVKWPSPSNLALSSPQRIGVSTSLLMPHWSIDPSLTCSSLPSLVNKSVRYLNSSTDPSKHLDVEWPICCWC